jgi:hypothetical protein
MTFGKKTLRLTGLDWGSRPSMHAARASFRASRLAWLLAAPLAANFAAALNGAPAAVFSLGLAASLLAPAPSAQAAPALTLDSLMGLLVQRRSGEAKFTEERTVSGLDAPLRASGLLTFSAPDRFARFTQQPRVESMEIDGNRVLLKRGSRSRTILLDAVPELTLLAEALRGTLSGDAPALQRHFRVEVGGTPGRWVLGLTPLDARLAGQVSRLEIAGENADVRSIELRLAGGDKSVMKLEPLMAPSAAASSPTDSRPGAE